MCVCVCVCVCVKEREGEGEGEGEGERERERCTLGHEKGGGGYMWVIWWLTSPGLYDVLTQLN